MKKTKKNNLKLICSDCAAVSEGYEEDLKGSVERSHLCDKCLIKLEESSYEL